MCMCGKPTINGEPGYSWDGKSHSIRKPNPPDLDDGDELLIDEPGRCGGLDCHCHHFRVVKAQSAYGGYFLLVRHGGGDERIPLGSRPGIRPLLATDSNSRFWLLQMMYQVQHNQAAEARKLANDQWTKAAAEKRIKIRKQRGSVKVWVEKAGIGLA